MTNTLYQQDEQALANAFTGSNSSTGRRAGLGSSDAPPYAVQLVDAIPYFNAPGIMDLLVQNFANACLLSLPTVGIAAQPNNSGYGYSENYSYTGPYNNYIEVFGPPQGSQTAAAGALIAAIDSLNNTTVNSTWLGNFGAALIADACGTQGGQQVNTSAIATAYQTYGNNGAPAVAPIYVSTLLNAYQPTASVLAQIAASGTQLTVANWLCKRVASPTFVAQTQSLQSGLDGQASIDFFLYNIWCLFSALGQTLDEINGYIGGSQNAGAAFSSLVGPNSWWNGGFAEWFTFPTGANVISSNFTASMPESQTNYQSGPPHIPPSTSYLNLPNGYAQSFISWSGLANQY